MVPSPPLPMILGTQLFEMPDFTGAPTVSGGACTKVYILRFVKVALDLLAFRHMQALKRCLNCPHIEYNNRVEISECSGFDPPFSHSMSFRMLSFREYLKVFIINESIPSVDKLGHKYRVLQ